MTFLVGFGFSLHDILDYEDGVTPLELCDYIEEAQTLMIQKEKQSVYSMTVALASLFKEGLLDEYMEGLDKSISGEKIDSAVKEAKKAKAQTKKSFKELGKLSSLFGGK